MIISLLEDMLKVNISTIDGIAHIHPFDRKALKYLKKRINKAIKQALKGNKTTILFAGRKDPTDIRGICINPTFMKGK